MQRSQEEALRRQRSVRAGAGTSEPSLGLGSEVTLAKPLILSASDSRLQSRGNRVSARYIRPSSGVRFLAVRMQSGRERRAGDETGVTQPGVPQAGGAPGIPPAPGGSGQPSPLPSSAASRRGAMAAARPDCPQRPAPAAPAEAEPNRAEPRREEEEEAPSPAPPCPRVHRCPPHPAGPPLRPPARPRSSHGCSRAAGGFPSSAGKTATPGRALTQRPPQQRSASPGEALSVPAATDVDGAVHGWVQVSPKSAWRRSENLLCLPERVLR